MNPRFPTLLPSVFTALLIVSGASSFAADWPQWRGANRDGRAEGFVAPATWPKELTQRWTAAVGPSDATPALVADRLYVVSRQGADEVTSCLDANTGKVIWEDKHAPGVTITGPAGSHPGPRSSPAVAEGKVVTLGVSEILSCLDANSGKVLWRKEFSKEFPKIWPDFYTSSSPLIVDGLCIAQVGGKGKGAVIAFDLAAGDVKWRVDGDGPAYSSPSLMTIDGTKVIVAQNEKNLLGVGASDGKILWTIPTPTQGMFQNAASPIVNGQTLIYSGQGKGTRAVRIEKKESEFAVKELWLNPQVGSRFSTPVLKGDLLFGLSDGKNAFYCMSAKNGQVLWTDAGKHDMLLSLVDAGPVILALDGTSAELIAFQPTDKQYTELARIKVSNVGAFAHPVPSGNRIFIKDQQAVTMFTVGEGPHVQ